MPKDPSPETLAHRAGEDARNAAEPAVSHRTPGLSRAEPPRRRAHRDRIKTLLTAARPRPQTA